MGERRTLPQELITNGGLEGEPQTKLKLPHAASVEIILDIGDLAGISSAVDTSVALRAGKRVDRMVENVVRIHTELGIEALGDLEVLRNRRLAAEVPRTSERVTAKVSVGTACRQRERARRWTRKRTSILPDG